jgi:PKD repeat protein
MKNLLLLITLLISTIHVFAQNCIADFNFRFDDFNPAKVLFTNTSTGSNLIYRWDFDDSQTSTIPSLNKTFKENGNYNVCLQIQNTSDTTCNSKVCKTVSVQNINKCLASYNFERDSINPLKLKFHSNSFGYSLNYLWAFGDGTFSNQTNPEKVYSDSGKYNICLTVTRPSSNGSSKFCNEFVVGNFVNTCTSSFSFFINNPPTLEFYAPVFNPTLNRIKQIWDFGDSTIVENHKPILRVFKQYKDAGKYIVCLKQFDTVDLAYTSSTCNIINILPEWATNKCTAKFNFSQTANPLRVLFNAHSNYTTNEAKYLWTFGDGDTSTLKNPFHQYKSNGTYTICLNVVNNDGSCQMSHCITELFIDPNVAINESIGENLFDVYPNPVEDKLTIKRLTSFGNKIEIQLFDLNGKLLNHFIPDGNNEIVEMELSNLKTGFYILHFKGEDINFRKRIIKN